MRIFLSPTACQICYFQLLCGVFERMCDKWDYLSCKGREFCRKVVGFLRKIIQLKNSNIKFKNKWGWDPGV